MKKISDNRKIKTFGDIIKKGTSTILFNRLQEWSSADTNMYQTQFFINNSGMIANLQHPDNKQLVKSNRTKSELMTIPDLSLPLTDILNMYDVDNYEELIELIKKLLFDNAPEYTIFRLVNIYTRINYNDLKKTNNSLIKIFKLIFNKEATNHIELSKYKINEDKLSAFLNKWFQNNDENNFYLNICEDVINFLSDKYEYN